MEVIRKRTATGNKNVISLFLFAEWVKIWQKPAPVYDTSEALVAGLGAFSKFGE